MITWLNKQTSSIDAPICSWYHIRTAYWHGYQEMIMAKYTERVQTVLTRAQYEDALAAFRGDTKTAKCPGARGN